MALWLLGSKFVEIRFKICKSVRYTLFLMLKLHSSIRNRRSCARYTPIAILSHQTALQGRILDRVPFAWYPLENLVSDRTVPLILLRGLLEADSYFLMLV